MGLTSFLLPAILIAISGVMTVHAGTAVCGDDTLVTDGISFVGGYEGDAVCSWLVQPDGPSGWNYIKLNFTFFNSEGNYDYVTVYDGPNFERNVWSGSGQVRPLPVVYARGPTAKVTFTSDAWMQLDGFSLVATAAPWAVNVSDTPLPTDGTVVKSLVKPIYYNQAFKIDIPVSQALGWYLIIDAKCDVNTDIYVNHGAEATPHSYEAISREDVPHNFRTILPNPLPGVAYYVTVQTLGRLDDRGDNDKTVDFSISATIVSSPPLTNCPFNLPVNNPSGAIMVPSFVENGKVCSWDVNVRGAIRITLNVTIPNEQSSTVLTVQTQGSLDSWTTDTSSWASADDQYVISTWEGSLTLTASRNAWGRTQSDAIIVRYTAVFPASFDQVPVLTPSDDVIPITLYGPDVTTLWRVQTTSDLSFIAHGAPALLMAASERPPAPRNCDASNWGTSSSPPARTSDLAENLAVPVLGAAGSWTYLSVWGGLGWMKSSPLGQSLNVRVSKGAAAGCAWSPPAVIPIAPGPLNPSTGIMEFVDVLSFKTGADDSCRWVFTAPVGYRIALIVTPSDQTSSVDVYDGASVSDAPLFLYNQLLGYASTKDATTGENIPAPLHISATGSRATLTFRAPGQTFTSGLRVQAAVMAMTTPAAQTLQVNCSDTTVRFVDVPVSFPNPSVRIQVYVPFIPETVRSTMALRVSVVNRVTDTVLFGGIGGSSSSPTGSTPASFASHAYIATEQLRYSDGVVQLEVPPTEGWHEFLAVSTAAMPMLTTSLKLTIGGMLLPSTHDLAPWPTSGAGSAAAFDFCRPTTLPLDSATAGSAELVGRLSFGAKDVVTQGYPVPTGVRVKLTTQSRLGRLFVHMGVPRVGTPWANDYWDSTADVGYLQPGQFMATAQVPWSTHVVADGVSYYAAAVFAPAAGGAPTPTAMATLIPTYDDHPPVLTVSQGSKVCIGGDGEDSLTNVRVVAPQDSLSSSRFRMALTGLTAAESVTMYVRKGTVPSTAVYDSAVSFTADDNGRASVIVPGDDAAETELFVGLELGTVHSSQGLTQAVASSIVFTVDEPPPAPGPAGPDYKTTIPSWVGGVTAVLAIVLVGVSIALYRTYKQMKTAQGAAARGKLVVDGVEMGRVKYGQLGEAGSEPTPQTTQPGAEIDGMDPDAAAVMLLKRLDALPVESVQRAKTKAAEEDV